MLYIGYVPFATYMYILYLMSLHVHLTTFKKDKCNNSAWPSLRSHNNKITPLTTLYIPTIVYIVTISVNVYKITSRKKRLLNSHWKLFIYTNYSMVYYYEHLVQKSSIVVRNCHVKCVLYFVKTCIHMNTVL